MACVLIKKEIWIQPCTQGECHVKTRQSSGRCHKPHAVYMWFKSLLNTTLVILFPTSPTFHSLLLTYVLWPLTFHCSPVFSVLHAFLYSAHRLYHLMKSHYSISKLCLTFCFVKIVFSLFPPPRNTSYLFNKILLIF